MKIAVSKLRIDPNHALKLMRGDKITIKVPKGAEAVELHLAMLPFPLKQERNEWAEIVDVFFNGRPAL